MKTIIISISIVFISLFESECQVSLSPIIGVDYLENPEYKQGYYTYIAKEEFRKPFFTYSGRVSYYIANNLQLTGEIILSPIKRRYNIQELPGFSGGYNRIEYLQALYSLTLEKKLNNGFYWGAGLNLLKSGVATKLPTSDRLLEIEVRNSAFLYFRPKVSIGYEYSNIIIQCYLLYGLHKINLPEPGFTHGRKINFGINLGYRMIKINVGTKSSGCPKF